MPPNTAALTRFMASYMGNDPAFHAPFYRRITMDETIPASKTTTSTPQEDDYVFTPASKTTTSTPQDIYTCVQDDYVKKTTTSDNYICVQDDYVDAPRQLHLRPRRSRPRPRQLYLRPRRLHLRPRLLYLRPRRLLTYDRDFTYLSVASPLGKFEL